MDVIQQCMKMTSFGGEAKSLALGAVSKAREGSFDVARELLEQAEQSLLLSHEAHTELLCYDADKEDLRVTLFMVHAADHLNAAEVVCSLAKDMIILYGGERNV